MKIYSNFLLSSLNCPKIIISGTAQSYSCSSTRRQRQNNCIHLLSSPIIIISLLLPLSSFTCLFVSAGQDMEEFKSFQEMLENSSNKPTFRKPAVPNFKDNLGPPRSSTSLKTGQKEISLAEESSPAPNLFKEYLTRGMYTCTSRYVHTIAKFHALIKDAYEEYASCQKLMKDTSKSFTPTQFELLDELLEEWQEEQEGSTTLSTVEDNAESSTSSAHLTREDILPASSASIIPEEDKTEEKLQTSRVKRLNQRVSRHAF